MNISDTDQLYTCSEAVPSQYRYRKFLYGTDTGGSFTARYIVFLYSTYG
jgi:hypothetical protein